VRHHRYQQIAEAITARIETGEFGSGGLLPSESALGAEYDVSRVTVRKALEALRDGGLVDSRQGFGWFVDAGPLPQDLGRLGTLEAQLEASGVSSERRIVRFGFESPPRRVEAALGAGQVLRVERVNLADGQPFARVTVWCPEAFGADLSRDDVARSSFHDLLDVDIGGATQTIGAVLASSRDAELLDVPEGAPLLTCIRTTRSTEGEPVLYSEHRFPAHRTEFVVDLPSVESSISPSGLRLVEDA
jgi:GntR family transcriptional regulator